MLGKILLWFAIGLGVLLLAGFTVVIEQLITQWLAKRKERRLDEYR